MWLDLRLGESCPAEDGEAPDSGRRSAPSLPKMGMVGTDRRAVPGGERSVRRRQRFWFGRRGSLLGEASPDAGARRCGRRSAPSLPEMGMVGTDRWAVPVRNGVEDGTNVVGSASWESCPAEDGEADGEACRPYR